MEAVGSLREMMADLGHTTAHMYEHVTGSPQPPPPPPPSAHGEASGLSMRRRQPFGPVLDNGMQSVLEHGDEENETS